MDTKTWPITDEENGSYSISKEYLDYLQRRDFELDCLERGGVDNWEYYSDSLRDGGYFDKND